MTQLEEVRTGTAGWPVARRYVGEDRVRVSLPVGGIGTGSVGFGGRGQFRDWELENHPSKGLLVAPFGVQIPALKEINIPNIAESCDFARNIPLLPIQA